MEWGGVRPHQLVSGAPPLRQATPPSQAPQASPIAHSRTRSLRRQTMRCPALANGPPERAHLSRIGGFASLHSQMYRAIKYISTSYESLFCTDKYLQPSPAMTRTAGRATRGTRVRVARPARRRFWTGSSSRSLPHSMHCSSTKKLRQDAVNVLRSGGVHRCVVLSAQTHLFRARQHVSRSPRLQRA